MQTPYLKHLVTAEDPQEALEESDDPDLMARRAREELDSMLGSDSDTSSSSEGTGPDLSDAKAAAKQALPPSKTEVTRATIGSEPTAMAAFSRNLPEGMTPSEALDELE